jgi:DNA-binding CsgD family transcriptional regulator
MMAVRNQFRHEGSARVIDSIYDAALDATLWPQALEALRAYIWADSAVLRVCVEAVATVIQATAVGFDSTFVLSYRDECVRIDPIVPILGALPAGRMILLGDAHTLHAQGNDRSHCQPLDEPHLMGGTLLRRGGTEIMVGLQRAQDAPAFSTCELTRLKKIVPHLARALSMTNRLEHVALRAKLVESMLGTAVTGIMLLDAYGRVIYLNPAAQGLISGQKALTIRQERLRTPYPKLQQWLDIVSVSARRATDRKYQDGASARFTAFDGTGDLALTVLPWKNTPMMPTFPVAEVATIALLTSLDCREIYSTEHIQTLFGLTRGEASLTAALVSTGSLAAAAQCLGIRPSTARDRLKSVFRKTGFTTQMALACAVVRSATRLVPPTPGDNPTATESL